MQGPRHRGFRTARVRRWVSWVALLAAAVLIASGCQDDEPSASAAAHYRRLLDANGRRIMVVDAKGHPVCKLRKRYHGYKVYDAHLAAVGYVKWRAAGDAGAARVTQRPLDGSKPASIEPVDDGNFEMAGHFRLEPTNRGWAVFGTDGKLMGAFEKNDEGKWQLRRRYGKGPVFTVEPSPVPTVVDADGNAVLRVDVGEVKPLVLLSLKIDTLSPLEQISAGLWMARRASEAGAAGK